MKLENVNVTKLQPCDVPKFEKCPCELCDDGCFDRAGYEHHPDCKRQFSKKEKLQLEFPCPISHYKATYQVPTNKYGKPADHRRKPFSPPPENEIPIAFKNAPLSSLTSQRDHYQPPPKNSIKRASTNSFKQKGNFAFLRAIPMETKSVYQAEYVEKPVKPPVLHPANTTNLAPYANSNEPAPKISSQTTTGTHFKPWQSTPSEPYAETPSIAGHVIFPDSSRNFSTSSGSTFVPFPNGSKAKSVLRLENRGNLRPTGSMNLHTSYRDTYIPHELTPRSAPFDRKGQLSEESALLLRPMDAISQTSSDFRAYPNHRPPLPADVDPFSSQITIGNSSKSEVTKSQYQSDYEGIDTSRHHRPPPVAPKDRQRLYVPTIQKMDTMTVTQRDFQPLDVSTLPRIRALPIKDALPLNGEHIPMESMTTSRHFYQPYEPLKINRQYGEPVPNIYVPPLSKFEGSTTTGDTYRGQRGQRAHPYIPDVRMLSQMGTQDHNTSYRVDYHPHGLTLCAARAYAIAQKNQTNAAPISAQ
ncbi:unnamed protein product [Adineta ricciae]|uniref:Uncharacterized protein n=1 Tax=Adineta ricciae TaxID=249248 RepID=A0A813VE62_ADIRI|nr:unnamed protein product [Adineta ricciae]CAF1073520.1 unnamed protein product [Adineta ricciae]